MGRSNSIHEVMTRRIAFYLHSAKASRAGYGSGLSGGRSLRYGFQQRGGSSFSVGKLMTAQMTRARYVFISRRRSMPRPQRAHGGFRLGGKAMQQGARLLWRFRRNPDSITPE